MNQTASGRGGRREGAGRKKGSLSKFASSNIADAIAGGELPHEFLLRVSRGEAITRKVLDPSDGSVKTIQEDYDMKTRIEAAKAASPFFAPKISTVEVITGVADDDLDAIIAQLAKETGISIGADGEGEEDEAGEPETPSRRVRLLD